METTLSKDFQNCILNNKDLFLKVKNGGELTQEDREHLIDFYLESSYFLTMVIDTLKVI